jgi:hypothetical protein
MPFMASIKKHLSVKKALFFTCKKSSRGYFLIELSDKIMQSSLKQYGISKSKINITVHFDSYSSINNIWTVSFQYMLFL